MNTEAGGYFKINVRGFRMVRRKVQNYLNESTFNIAEGVKEGAMLIKRTAQSKTPIVTGNLKASAYAASFMTSIGPGAEIGYTSIYAPAVHENPNAGKKGGLNSSSGEKQKSRVYSSKGEDRFLQKGTDENIMKVLLIIQKKAQFKTSM